MLCSVQSPSAVEHASRATVMDATRRVRGRDEALSHHPERPALVSPPRRAAVRHLTSPAMAAAPPENVRRRYPRLPEVQGPASAHRDRRREGRRAPDSGTPRLSGRSSAAGPRPRSDYARRRRARRRVVSEPCQLLARAGPCAVWA